MKNESDERIRADQVAAKRGEIDSRLAYMTRYRLVRGNTGPISAWLMYELNILLDWRLEWM